ncbi:unnamed protein product [Brugia timori]|uniref:Catalase n=1 Tax=Brugia timori TaxID=42155 RepID=A0A0R3QNC6_9BILA|nr:unnamed protein product [Brugia timori]
MRLMRFHFWYQDTPTKYVGCEQPVPADSGPVSRNYQYSAQSAELYDMTNQIELERSRHIKLKSENIG